MVLLGSMADVKKVQYDLCYVIVRSLRNKAVLNNPNTHWKPELSPSPSLFKWYLDKKADKQWNIESFQGYYTEQFLKEINSSKAVALLMDIHTRSQMGQVVLLVCFCEDEELCHRSIVGGIEQGVGTQVSSTSGKPIDYTRYYHQFMQTKK